MFTVIEVYSMYVKVLVEVRRRIVVIRPLRCKQTI